MYRSAEYEQVLEDGLSFLIILPHMILPFCLAATGKLHALRNGAGGDRICPIRRCLGVGRTGLDIREPVWSFRKSKN
jgi:hypothetical protein